MKAFIVAALLVASVASIDLRYRPNTRIQDLLLKEKMGMDFDTVKYSTPSMDNIFGDKWAHHTTTLYSWEELVSTPLFREYMRLPLFRQFIEEHPTVFRRYVESPLFQKFWTVPQFQMYFKNPMFFYKYIVPQVQYIAQEGTYNNMDTYEDSTSTYTPYAYRTRVPEYNRWSVPSMNMDKSFNWPYNTRMTTPTTTNYRYLLEKMMNHLKVNKHMAETMTDVKMLPSGEIKEQTFVKSVDPITGMEKVSVGDIKFVDEKITPRNMDFPTYGMEYNKINSIYGQDFVNTESLKDSILKHIILRKMLGNKGYITPQVYEALFSDNKDLFTPDTYSTIYKHKSLPLPELFDTVFSTKKHIMTPEIYSAIFGQKHMTPELFDDVFAEKKQVMTPELYELLFGQEHTTKVMPETLETIFGKKIYSPEVYGSLFGEKVNTPEVYNWENKMINPLVYRMLKNKQVNRPFTTYNFNNQMTLTAMEKKMVEEIEKEEMIKDMPIFTKEHNKFFNIESEIPKMDKIYKNIPLTFGKPLVGSQIEDFQQERELF